MGKDNQKTYHIGLTYPENMPDELADIMLEGVKEDGLQIQVRKEPITAYLALEWIAPTVLAAWVAKAYFEEFLKEAGKDHYQKLKSWLKKFIADSKDLPVRTITSSDSTDKVNAKYTQSRAVSLYLQTKSGRTIKVFFDNDLSKEDWESAVDVMLDYIIENYEKHPHDTITAQIKDLEKKDWGWVYAMLDKESKGWIFYDDRKLMQKNNLL